MKKYHSAKISADLFKCSSPALDEWNALATFLADVIEKYASVLEMGKVESLSNDKIHQDPVDTVLAA